MLSRDDASPASAAVEHEVPALGASLLVFGSRAKMGVAVGIRRMWRTTACPRRIFDPMVFRAWRTTSRIRPQPIGAKRIPDKGAGVVAQASHTAAKGLLNRGG